MDRNKFSRIGHAHHSFYNPISEKKVERILDILKLNPQDKVVDIGSGKCEILVRLIEKYDVTGTGIELNESFIEQAGHNAADRVQDKKLLLVNKDARHVISNTPDSHYDMGLCIGSTHALGGLEKTIRELKRCVKSGGYILIGEGYWKVKPSTEYLKDLESDEDELNSHFSNLKLAEDFGLVSLWSTVASEDDWDEYECLYSMSIENYCYENPGDPDCREMLKKIRDWRQTYFSMGRDTLGFGLYLFRNMK
jgi:SAM-dependent methyltransferase